MRTFQYVQLWIEGEWKDFYCSEVLDEALAEAQQRFEEGWLPCHVRILMKFVSAF